MLKTLKNRFEQGYRTSRYPRETIQLPERYRGVPRVNPEVPEETAVACADACPQAAIDAGARRIDLGRCVFCGACERLSAGKFIEFSRDFELSTANRADLVTQGELPRLADHAKQHFKKLFGRSLQLRQVSAAGCNACEADLNVLATPFFDLARFGINFVASPRHADGIVVTGPISRNMKTALLQTYDAVPDPKVVIAVGSCAISGGPFRGSPEITEGLETLIPVDLFIPGCPPHPLTNLHALLNFFK
jgi:Ni,Fe-hydrogenase III small subunit